MINTKVVETENKKETTQPVVRRRKRQFSSHGPLSGVPQIPGFRLYWAVDGDAKRTNRIHKLTKENDYEFVKPEEIGETNSDGTPTTNTRVTRDAGNGVKLILLKIPTEMYFEDMKEKEIENLKAVRNKASENTSAVNSSDLKETSHINL